MSVVVPPGLSNALRSLPAYIQRPPDFTQAHFSRATAATQAVSHLAQQCSEMGDERPLSGCQFSPDGQLVALCGEHCCRFVVLWGIASLCVPVTSPCYHCFLQAGAARYRCGTRRTVPSSLQLAHMMSAAQMWHGTLLHACHKQQSQSTWLLEVQTALRP